MAADYPPWYPLNVDDFDNGTADMDVAAVGGYVRLMNHQWKHGHLPTDRKALARIMRATPRQMAEIWPQIEAKFLPVKGAPDQLVNPRTHAEKLKTIAKSEAAQASAAARWAKRVPGASGYAIASAGAHADAPAITDPIGHTTAPTDAHAEDMRSHDTVYKSTHTPPRAIPTPQPPAPPGGAFTAERFEQLFREVTRYPTGGTDGEGRSASITAHRKCVEAAQLEQPPEEPEAFARGLLAAFVGMLADWRGRGVQGAPTVPLLVLRFALVVGWRRGERPAPPEAASARRQRGTGQAPAQVMNAGSARLLARRFGEEE